MRMWRRGALGALTAFALAGVIIVGAGAKAHANGSDTQSCNPWTAGNGGGAGVVQMMCKDHNATQTMTDYIPCVGGGTLANITMTYNDTFHVNELTSGAGAGTFWATGTQTGDFVAAPLDASLPTYTGHFTTWFGDNNNLHNGSETSTFSIHGVGSDGSTISFHEVAHASVSATGVTVTFDKPTCNA